MFRALFRLLSGCGTKTKSEADITTPLDLILINGQKDKPLRYLSNEYTKDQLRTKLQRPGDTRPLDVYSSYAKYQPVSDNRFIEKWPVLPSINVDERYWLDGAHHVFLKELLFLDDDELKKTHDLQQIINRREIARKCRDGVALHSWVSGAFEVSQNRIKLKKRNEIENNTTAYCHELPDIYCEQYKESAVDFVNRMDAAAGRGGVAQILREILEVHKPELRIWGAALHKSLNDVNTLGQFRVWPSPRLRLTALPEMDETITNEANYVVDLVYLILTHLALFPMPVEPRVLYGCDEIYRILQKICHPLELSKRYDPPSNKHTPHNWRDTNRLVRLRFLSQVLKYLTESSLIIAVRGKPTDPQTTHSPIDAGDILNIGGADRTAEDIHTRYTIQHQLRDFTARLMDLSLPDQGERNFFQVSVYCDQPRDLPAPREDHYALVRHIMDRQIEQTRNTIWVLLQLIKSNPSENLQKTDQGLLRHGLRRRILKLSDQQDKSGEPVLDPQLPSIHAAPQRIRALYGLLRSGFSIGTVSRLRGFQERDIDQPYERFKGWLRGVTNAAIGWDVVLDELFYKSDPDSNEVNQKKTNDTISKIGRLLEEGPNAMQPLPPNPEELQNFKGFSRPLYRDEVGWLLNERGVVSLVQGQIFDAIPLFRRALDEMHHEETAGHYDPALHAAVRRVRLNLAIALIDRGHLGRAGTILQDLQLPSDFSSHSGSQISWLSNGYTGLIHHLSGNLDLALSIYDETINRAQEREMMRVVGIFSKHKADLLRRMEDFNGAWKSISMATNAALNCAQRDILHLAKISEGSLTLADPSGDNSEAATCMIEALHFAQTMGIPRLESEARRLQAAMMLAQGERMLAGSAASEAAAIANRNGLRLEKLHALRFYGASLRLRGQIDLANQVLTETQRESERRGYQGLAKSLAQELRQIL